MIMVTFLIKQIGCFVEQNQLILLLLKLLLQVTLLACHSSVAISVALRSGCYLGKISHATPQKCSRLSGFLSPPKKIVRFAMLIAPRCKWGWEWLCIVAYDGLISYSVWIHAQSFWDTHGIHSDLHQQQQNVKLSECIALYSCMK